MIHEQIPNPSPIDLSYLGQHPDELAVTNSGIVSLQKIKDGKDGLLRVGESGKNVPIRFERFFTLDQLTAEDAIRGKHAHRKLKQVIFSVRGKFDLVLDDGKYKQTVNMDTPDLGVILDGLIWHDMVNYRENCLILVLADAWYDEADYVRDYEEFRKLADEKSI